MFHHTLAASLPLETLTALPDCYSWIKLEERE